jgi:competence protein ComGC
MIASNNDREPGFTLIEIIVVIATIVIFFAIFLPALAKQKSKKERMDCVNNLKQVGLSFRIWPADSSDWYPMARSTNDGGTMEFVQTSEVFRHFQILSNELGSPNRLICPADRERIAAKDFLKLANTNISYFLGPDANENLPQSILSGDRNITNGFAPKNGSFVLMTNQSVGWTKELHKYQGNIALGDGSVQQVDSARLQKEFLAETGFPANRITLP